MSGSTFLLRSRLVRALASFATLAACPILSGGVAHAIQAPPSIFTVTQDTEFPNDGVCDEACSLREAIAAANADGDASTVEFSPTLAGQSLGLSSADDTALGASALLITTPITINGLTGNSGITLTRSSLVTNLRLFRVTSVGSLTLRDLTIANGTAIGGNGENTGARGAGGGGAGLGGAILVGDGGAAGGSLTIERCTFKNNSATGGNGGVAGQGGNGLGFGGGLRPGSVNNGGPGDNGGFGFGGNGGSQAVAPGSTPTKGGNGGLGAGGAGGGAAVFTGGDGGFGGGSVFGGVGGNATSGIAGGGGGGAGMGSAIFNYGGTVSLLNSTLTQNTASGGASGGNGAADGQSFGTVFNSFGTLSVNNCTLSGNTATVGGAIYNYADAGNTSTTDVNNSILANSLTSGGSSTIDYVSFNSGGTPISIGAYNVVESSFGFGGTNTISTDPDLGALASNGGPTQTMSITDASSAYNAGDPNFVGTGLTDQRGAGFARISGSTVDIGAYELVANATPVAVGPDSLTTGQNVAKTVTLVGEDADTTDTLAYIITSLPDNGTLYDGAGTTTAIMETPYTLLDTEHRVTFRSSTLGDDNFNFRVNDGTIDSADKTVTTTVTDVTAPTVAITVPADKSLVTSLASISGVASDNVGIVRVDLYLQRQNDKKFWNGESWTAFGEGSTLSTTLTPVNNGVGRVAAGKTQPRSINAAPDVTWTASSPLPGSSALQSGPYFIAARAVDVQGNGTSTSALINVDVLAPVIVIGSPAASAAVATTPVINGIASDTQGGSGLDRVTLVLRRNGVGDYWNGTNWAGTTPVAFNATLTGTSWKRDGGLPVVATSDATKKLTDGSYTIAAAAYDRAGNLSTIPTRNFTVDTKKPVVAISTPANNANVSTLPSVSGTASDVGNGSGVATVALYLQRKSDNKYWNGTSWVAPVSALTTTLSGTTWTRNSGLPSGADLSIGNYFLAARATDRAGNGESAISNFRVVAGSSVAQASPSTVALSSASAKSDGTIRLSFTGALGASAGDANSYAVNNGAITIATVSQPDASTVEIKASALASGARIAVAYDVQDAQGRSLKGSANVVVK